MVDRDTYDHLRGIVAIWLTNGQKPVEGGNDTRYDFFRGGVIEAWDATRELVNAGLCEFTSPNDEDGYNSDYYVIPTAKGIGECLR